MESPGKLCLQGWCFPYVNYIDIVVIFTKVNKKDTQKVQRDTEESRDTGETPMYL